MDGRFCLTGDGVDIDLQLRYGIIPATHAICTSAGNDQQPRAKGVGLAKGAKLSERREKDVLGCILGEMCITENRPTGRPDGPLIAPYKVRKGLPVAFEHGSDNVSIGLQGL